MGKPQHRNSNSEIRSSSRRRFFHRQYREIPENIINVFCADFPSWFPHGFSGLEFTVENRDSENASVGNISGHFFDSQNDPFRVISRETTHEGVEIMHPSTTANQRHRAARRAQGFKETTIWLPNELDTAINRYVKDHRYPSRREAVTEALEAHFMPEKGRT